MRISVAHILIGVLVLTVFYLAVWIVRILTRKKQYTRERFAFVALVGILSMGTTLFSTFAHKETFWGALTNLAREVRGLPAATELPHATDHMLMVIVLVIIVMFILRIYEQWNGAISTRQFDQQRFHEPAPFLSEGLREAKRILKREAPPEIYNSEQYRKLSKTLEPPTDSLAWHDQARDLICLRSSSYSIDPHNDWHEKVRCWIGLNKKSSEVVAVYCNLQDASTSQLESFVEYVESVISTKSNAHPNPQIEFIVAIRDSTELNPATIRNRTLQKETEDSLLADLVDFTDYYDTVRRRVERQTLPDSSITIQQVYTPSGFRLETGAAQRDLEAYLRSWLLEPGQRQLALLGEYGQGKSTTALMTAYHLINEQSPSQTIPILIELRGKSPKHMTPEEILATWAVPYRISPQAVMKLLIAGRIFLILEGYDEMALVGDSETRLSHFRTLWKFCYPKTKILFTGRPNFFLDDQEMRAALGIAKASAAGPYCEALTLQPFDLEQIAAALRAASPKIRDEIVNLAKSDAKFRELVSRGSLLYVVSQLWEREGLWRYAGHITSAFVMKLFIQHSYKRQTQKSFQSAEFMVLTEGERKFFMSGIAASMGALGLPNQILREQFDKAVKTLYDAIPDSVSLSADAPPATAEKPLRIRLAETEDPVQDVSNDVRSSGILVPDESKSGAFRFAHKSFMEFLIAEVYSDYVSGGRNRETTSAIIRATHLNASHLVDHPEQVSFMTELFLSSPVGTGGTDSVTRETIAELLFTQIVVTPLGSGLLAKFKAWVGLRQLKARAATRIGGLWGLLTYFRMKPDFIFLFAPLITFMFLVYLDLVWFHGGFGLMLSRHSIFFMFFLFLLMSPAVLLQNRSAMPSIKLRIICCMAAEVNLESMAKVTGRRWASLLVKYCNDEDAMDLSHPASAKSA